MPDTADVFDYYAGWVDKLYGETCPVEGPFLNYTLREPIGVCALIVPWNFPLLLAGVEARPGARHGQHRRAESPRPSPRSRWYAFSSFSTRRRVSPLGS